MNDRYLFKAKDYMTDEWIVGSLIMMDWDSGYVFIAEPYECASTMPVRELLCNNTRLVKKETICQCTGILDKEKNLIWENDVVFVTGYSYIEPEFELNGKVTWSLGDSCFEIDGVPIVESKGSYLTEYHVLGNIFDDPELLEVE